jgi:exosortase A-associated hydrolase 1
MLPDRRPLVFPCGDVELVGVLHAPPDPAHVGVVVVVGGPQYRVGSHRQFVHLADWLAASGYPTLRFDYRGMGDSGGEFSGFEGIDPDIDAAVAALRQACPGVRQVVLWGLCDAATAAAFYARNHPVAGLVLANPWVRTAEGMARSYVQNYYGQRLLSRDFWVRLLTGQMSVLARLREFLADWRTARGSRSDGASTSLPERLRASLERFPGPVLLLMSGDDLTAGEFDLHLKGESWVAWRARSQVSRVDLPGVDHTFSSPGGRSQVNEATVDWLRRLPR